MLATVRGPIVLVGHSYGGAVITNAATGNPNVKALVYVAAFAPDTGETLGGLGAAHPGGQIGPSTLDLHPFTAPDGAQGIEGTIKVPYFRRIFAADVPKPLAMAMAVSQRPIAAASLSEASGDPAWRHIPSWFLVAGRDLAIGTELERFEARRMHAKTTVAKGSSHAVLVSHPDLTTKVILAAAQHS